MGMWGLEAFSNDDAWDWFQGNEEEKDSKFIEKEFDFVLETPVEELSCVEVTAAVAAAVVIATCLNKPYEGTPEQVLESLNSRNIECSDSLRLKAIEALERMCQEESGTNDDFEDDIETYKEWIQEVQKICQHLKSL
jgi:Domain of unknown function (DUF4259)